MEVEQGVRTVAAALDARLTDLADSVQSQMHAEVPEFYVNDDPALRQAESDAIRESLEAIMRGLVDQLEVEATVPGAMLKQARLAAQANVSLYALLRKSRIAQSVTWDAFLDVAQHVISDDDLRGMALRRISQYQFAWNDVVSAALVSEYEAEHRLYFLERPDRKKRAIVNAVLAGSPPDEAAMGYQLTGWHFAVVAWGEHPEAAIQAIGATQGSRHLKVSTTDGAVFAWFRSVRKRNDQGPDLSAVKLPMGTRLAIGQYAEGVEGFRRSHRQAGLAYRVARLGCDDITAYRDVALEALLLRDLAAASEFVQQELGPLLDGSPRSRTLLETVKIYYATGHNASATGLRLGVNERTVAYRLRSLEDALGNTVWQRRDEIAAAIRVAALLQHASAGASST